MNGEMTYMLRASWHPFTAHGIASTCEEATGSELASVLRRELFHTVGNNLPQSSYFCVDGQVIHQLECIASQ